MNSDVENENFKNFSMVLCGPESFEKEILSIAGDKGFNKENLIKNY